VVLRIVLGVLLLGMAAGQLASWREMPQILAAYEVGGLATMRALAVGLVVGETVAGGWFLARPRTHAMGPVWVYAAVSMVWAGLAVQAYIRGLPVGNCGCFGVYLAQRLGGFVLVQDALLLVYAVVLVRQGLGGRWRVVVG
jgi:hypothetical protein